MRIRKAVDCVLHGIDDRSVRLGAEAVQFDDLDKLLTYLRNSRNVKINPDKRNSKPLPLKNSADLSQSSNQSQSTSFKRKIRCANCKTEGHIVSQCSLPIKKCTKCFRIGHETEKCYFNASTSEKSVNRVGSDSDAGQKFFKTALVNKVPIDAFVDLDSECSMLKESYFTKLGIKDIELDGLPVLKGFGNSFVAVLGRINVQIEIDGVGAYTELLLVPDDAMKMPLMIGQTYTEQPHILIHKTCERFDILLNLTNVVTNNKISLHSLESVIVSGLTIVKVYTNPKFTGVLFVEGGLRTKNGVHHYIPTGIYEFNELGEGTIVINGLNSKTFSVIKDDLVARGKIAYEETKRDILRVMTQDHQSQSRPITLSDLHIGINRTPAEALFGVRPKGVSDSKLIVAIDEGVTTNNKESDLTTIREEISSFVASSQQQQKERYDKTRSKPVQFNEGDLVRVERQVPATGNSKKLVPKYQGPYKITKVYAHDRYQIEDTPLTRKGNKKYSTVVAVDKLKPWLNFSRPNDNILSEEESD
ncbi:hypothetical protein HF086_007297 [Spodoptera exigua]|uniref:Uncharacterized protein n=1 Tax=Spodoptera exigua TaxID=7107 RepID=A0A922SKF3_SPOEX|nr:hypothetical protein HF086_007297 [Spodoptera exigua]